jgi:hypothetical protein
LLIVKRLVGTTLIAAAVAIALLAYRSATGGRTRAEATARGEADRQAALRRAELRAIEGKVQTAADLRALNAALGAHVDSATMIDLLDNEDWWRPYREEFPLVRVIVGGSVVAGRGAGGGVAVGADVVKAARRQMVASAQTTIGTASYLLAAARLPALSDDDAILLLGRPATAQAPVTVAPAPPERVPPLPWAIAGGVALAGVALLVSGGGKRPVGRAAATTRTRLGPAPEAAPAQAAADDATVIPIIPETTQRFGEPREPRNDVGPAPAPAPTVVIVSPNAGPPVVFGRYRLVDRLSEGGMSELFIAKAAGIEGFTRSFVLKRLRPELARDNEAVAQFIDEARLQADLVHSNIVPVFDFGVVGGEYFMTQEYIAGRDLGRLMERHAGRGARGLPSPVAYYAAHETLQALAYAHSKRGHNGAPLGIVHRDIAAGNILVSLAGEVKLSDFGIVKSNDRVSRTQVGIVKGNANFMSPEQARGQAVDARSDLFSLGLVLYHCLSGEMLYPGHSDLEVLHHAAGGLLRDDFERIRRLPDPAPQILERALALDPNERFQSAFEFADELAIHMGGGRNGAAQLVRELFARELQHETALPTATSVGYTAGP